MVYVSGKEKLKPDQQSGFSMDAIKSIEVQVANIQGGVDILLTSQWPKDAERFAASLVSYFFINYYIIKERYLIKNFLFLRKEDRVKNSAPLY